MRDNVCPYLTFSGNCREAMTFYQRCIGGELSFQTVEQSPIGDEVPREMKDYILQARLVKGNLLLMASDMVGETGLKKGNSVSLMLYCKSKKEIKTCYNSLSELGLKTTPLAITFSGSVMGGLTDRFGNHWILNYQVNE